MRAMHISSLFLVQRTCETYPGYLFFQKRTQEKTMKQQTSGTATQGTQANHQLEENLFHFLTGYCRGRPDHLTGIIGYSHWQARAKNVLHWRAGELLERLDTETVAAIADGRIDIIQIAKRVVADQ